MEKKEIIQQFGDQLEEFLDHKARQELTKLHEMVLEGHEASERSEIKNEIEGIENHLINLALQDLRGDVDNVIGLFNTLSKDDIQQYIDFYQYKTEQVKAINEVKQSLEEEFKNEKEITKAQCIETIYKKFPNHYANIKEHALNKSRNTVKGHITTIAQLTEGTPFSWIIQFMLTRAA